MKKLFLRLQPPIFLKRLCSFILAFVLAFGLWFGNGARVEAADGPFTKDYGDYTFYYYVGDFNLYCLPTVNYSRVEFDFAQDDDVVTFLYLKSDTLYFWCCNREFNDINLVNTLYKKDGNTTVINRELSYNTSSAYSTFGQYLDTSFYPTSFSKTVAWEFVCSNDFINEEQPIYYFEKHSPQMDIAFSLKKATASVQDGMLSASWNGTSNMTVNLYQNTLVDVSINYTDLDSGNTYDIQYPLEAAASGLNVNFVKPGNTYYLVSDNGFEIELSELEADYFGTTNYTINSICLTPYYYGNDNVISDNIYIGLSSVIDIGYDSTVGEDVISDSTQVILPGTNYDPKDPFKSLYDQQNDLFQGMINGYDNSGMNQDNAALSDSLAGYDAATGAIFDSASDTLESFSFEDNLSFSVGLVTALGFVKGFVDDFFVASGDFSVIVTVVFTLIFMSMVIGIARFKGK